VPERQSLRQLFRPLLHPSSQKFGIYPPEPADLEDLCKILNVARPLGDGFINDRLRGLVCSWRDSGPNLEAMKRENPDFWEKFHSSVKAEVETTTNGMAQLLLVSNLDKRDPDIGVCYHFARLILNPECEKLCGPCKRCGAFYVKKRASQIAYCSRRCGNAATAVARTRARLANVHQDKLTRAKRAQAEWERGWNKGRITEPWKEYISRAQPDITPKFLTRAVNRGEIKSPTGKQKGAN
jgi:hypothetical protein